MIRKIETEGLGCGSGALGLSNAHISPLENVGCNKINHLCHSVEIARGGRFLCLKTPLLDRQEQIGGGVRGNVKGFSYQSRQRLMRKIHSINEELSGKPSFITLTYPGSYSDDPRQWKRHIDVFNKRLIRRYPESWGLWRLEFQRRGAPHFHLLVWDGPRVLQVRNSDGRFVNDRDDSNNRCVFDWLSKSWFEIVGSGDEKHLKAGTRIEGVQSWNGVVYYTSKYIAKSDGEGRVCGRYWGIINKQFWKVEIFGQEVTEDQFFRIKRVLRAFMRKKLKRKFRINSYGITCFLSHTESIRLMEWVNRDG